MITFYPGPSKVYPQIELYLSDAYHCGILSVNHRSEAFMKMLEGTIGSVKRKLDIPAGYEVYFVSSATECWEIISQSLVSNASYHIYNGAFGAKWMEYAQKLNPDSHGISFDLNEAPGVELLAGMRMEDDVLCITHNETSNGTALPVSFIEDLRRNTEKVIAVDATSSMAGIALPWLDADVWYASVQKCFGLPAGLGVMVVSPKAILKASEYNEQQHYNSLLFTRDNFLKSQTPYTPNTLAIYLLGRVMEQVRPIETLSREIGRRADEMYALLETLGYTPLVHNEKVRSETVIAVKMERTSLAAIKLKAKQQNIVLGNGYGNWKEGTFRVANFPAITSDDISVLKHFLADFESVS